VLNHPQLVDAPTQLDPGPRPVSDQKAAGAVRMAPQSAATRPRFRSAAEITEKLS